MLVYSISQAQTNPVINLSWESQYDFGNYHFVLQWEQPQTPHDEILGYNIYRDDELYRFQQEQYLASIGIAINCGQDFMVFESDGDGFEIHVTAVYANGMESGYSETAFAYNNLLSKTSFTASNFEISPNPTAGIVHIKNAEAVSIQLFDATGKNVFSSYAASELDLSALPSGTYFACMTRSGQTATHRIIRK